MVSLPTLGRWIQCLILASVALGAGFLLEVQPLLPPAVFDFITAGWALFVVDGLLTFLRPRVSYYFGSALAALALASSLPQSTHWQFIAQGEVLPSLVFVGGSSMQVAIIALVAYYVIRLLRHDQWSWPDGNVDPSYDDVESDSEAAGPAGADTAQDARASGP